MMKAVTYQKNQDCFSVSQLKLPQLQNPFDVLVKVHAVGLNPVDSKINLWHSMVENMGDDFVGGLDISGEIIAVGEAVQLWKVSDRVLYHGNMRRHCGGFAEYALQDSRTLTLHPNISTEIAAATPCAAWTAYRALHDKLNIKSRKSLFIAGASGGVGSFAVQLAKIYNIQTIITTCSSQNHDYVKGLGATHIIDYRAEDIISRVREITKGQGVEASIDCVGGENDIIAASVLGFEGEMVEIVKEINAQTYPQAFLKGLSFHQLSLGSGHVNGEYGRSTIVKAGRKVSRYLEEGSLTVPQLKIISLEDIGDALMEMRSQRTVGKIVASF